MLKVQAAPYLLWLYLLWLYLLWLYLLWLYLLWLYLLWQERGECSTLAVYPTGGLGP